MKGKKKKGGGTIVHALRAVSKQDTATDREEHGARGD